MNQQARDEDAVGVVIRMPEGRQIDRFSRRLASIVESSQDAIISYDLVGLVTSWNKGAEALYGFKVQEAVGARPPVVPPNLAREFEMLLENAAAGRGTGPLETTRLDRYGRELEVVVSMSPILDASGKPVGCATTSRDISEHKAAERRLRASEERYRLLVEAAPFAIVVADAPTHKIIFANSFAAALHGFNGPHEMVGLNSYDLIPPECKETAVAGVAEAVRRGKAQGLVYGVLRADGSKVPIEASTAVIRDEAGAPHSMIHLYQDITERLAFQKQLAHQAHHDPLTDLPNRTLLGDHLERAIRSARQAGTHLAVLMIDLDRFKEVNDTLGHEVGDEMLVAVGRRFRKALRMEDTVARFGGDEFAVVLPRTDATGAAATAQRLRSTLNEPFQTRHHSVYLDAQIGIATFPDDGEDASSLLRRADVAMYGSKNSPTRIGVYSKADDPHSEERLKLIAELRCAVTNGEFELHYQPQVVLESGAVFGVEALIRWRHPERGLIGPAEFLPIAEHTGLTSALTEWVLEEALRQSREWHEQGMALHMAINISTWSLRDPLFVETVKLAREKWDAEMCNLTLEVTETGLMADPRKSLSVLNELSAAGLSIAIDDFGTGYSSLAYLDQVPAQDLKIDRVFVSDLDKDEKHRRIVQATIALAHDLGLRVIAEGVENKNTERCLAAYGCELAQGHWISPALPPCELTRWLRRRASRLARHINVA